MMTAATNSSTIDDATDGVMITTSTAIATAAAILACMRGTTFGHTNFHLIILVEPNHSLLLLHMICTVERTVGMTTDNCCCLYRGGWDARVQRRRTGSWGFEFEG